MGDLNTIGGLHYEMMRRCYNPKSIAYKSYGAAGISVCEEWHNRDNFRKWCIENGYTKGKRVCRIDASGGYEPNNCFLEERNVKKSGVAEHNRSVKMHRKQMKEFAGIDGNYSKTRIYRIYVSMHTRCEDEACEHYNRYGGRGIKVCDEWSGRDGFFYFYKWANENGYSDKLSIDRIDNDKGYFPKNCRWVTMNEQAINKSSTKKYFYKGNFVTLSDVAKENSIAYGMLYNRIKKNMTVEEAINDIKNKY